MKYFNVGKRALWEMKHRAHNPLGCQNYRMSQSISIDQENIELKIKKYQDEGRRLSKKMRNYIRSKEKSE